MFELELLRESREFASGNGLELWNGVVVWKKACWSVRSWMVKFEVRNSEGLISALFLELELLQRWRKAGFECYFIVTTNRRKKSPA